MELSFQERKHASASKEASLRTALEKQSTRGLRILCDLDHQELALSIQKTQMDSKTWFSVHSPGFIRGENHEEIIY